MVESPCKDFDSFLLFFIFGFCYFSEISGFTYYFVAVLLISIVSIPVGIMMEKRFCSSLIYQKWLDIATKMGLEESEESDKLGIIRSSTARGYWRISKPSGGGL